MEGEFKFDPIDIMRFMPVAVRQATRKGFLKEIKMGNDFERKYFVLCGNLLYSFYKENDMNTLCGIMFLESSILKIVTNLGALALSVSAVGGKTLLLTTDLQTELVEWMEAIENSKFISLSRKLDDTEARFVQLNHQVEQQEVKNQEYQRSFVDMKEQMALLNAKNAELEATIVALKTEAREMKSTLRTTEKERSLLLKSRGITPKELPLWALSEQPRGGVTEPPESIRIWTGTWNLGSSEPFAGMDKNRAQRLLQPLVPSGYDLYVLGVQECVSDSVFDSLNGLLEAEGCRRLRLDNLNTQTNMNSCVDVGPSSVSSSNSALAAPMPSCTGIGAINTTPSSSDMSKLVGRGDGSLLSMKYAGIAVYAHVDILPDVRILSITNIPFSTKHSTGGVAVALSVMGRTMVFVCCQLDHKSNETRKDQYTTLLTQLGTQLAETGFHLNEQFHHVIWCGDFNYTLVDTSGRQMPPDTVVKMLQDGRLFRTLFDTHDQLNQEKREKNVFFMYREASPFPNFYPTSKKVENRNPVDYAHPSWVANTYRTYTKAPFYKGGGTKEYTPCFSDRVLYHSMVDLSEDFVPECMRVEMSVHRDKGNSSPESGSSRSSKGSGGSDKVVSIVGAGTTKSIAVTIDNYRSVNDGEGLNVSHHSPVYATFVLRLRHNFTQILADSANNKSLGSIGSVLSVLSSGKTVEFPIDTSAGGGVSSGVSGVGMTTPPRSKHSSRYSSGATDPTHKRSNLSQMLHNTDTGTATNTTITTNTSTANTTTTSVPRTLKYSLLPAGVYRIKITNIKLIWGMNEESPASVSLLFPAPYEAVAGERFVDFKSDTDVTPTTATNDDTFNLSSVSSSIPISGASGGSGMGSGSGDGMNVGSPARGINSGSYVNSGSYMNSSYVSTSGIANYSAGSRTSRNINTSSSVPSTPTKGKPSLFSNNNTTNTTNANTTYELWERCAPSRTGTCLALCAGAYYKQQAVGPLSPDSASGGGTTSAAKAPLAPLVLTWRGQEPLDKLHLSMRVCIPAFSLHTAKSRPGSARIDSTASGGSGGSGTGGGSGNNRNQSGEGGERDVITGHCAIGMEQLCKVAMVSSGGIGGCVTVTRILVNQGRPMYNIDARSLQREMVTLCCSMELLPNETE